MPLCVGMLFCCWETLNYSKSLSWQATAANVHTRSWFKYTATCCPVGNYQWLLWSHSPNVQWLVAAAFWRQKVFSWAFYWYHISYSMYAQGWDQLTPPDLQLHSSSVWGLWQVRGISAGMSSTWKLTVPKDKENRGLLILMSMVHQFLVVYLISFPYTPFPNTQILKKDKVLAKSVKQSQLKNSPL